MYIYNTHNTCAQPLILNASQIHAIKGSIDINYKSPWHMCMESGNFIFQIFLDSLIFDMRMLTR